MGITFILHSPVFLLIYYSERNLGITFILHSPVFLLIYYFYYCCFILNLLNIYYLYFYCLCVATFTVVEKRPVFYPLSINILLICLPTKIYVPKWNDSLSQRNRSIKNIPKKKPSLFNILKTLGSMNLCSFFPEYVIFYCRSQWPRGLRRRSAAARLLRSWVRIPPGAWMFVCCECCVLSVRGLCDELITRPEDSYRLWCVVVCDLETSWMRRSWLALGRRATEKKYYIPLF